jgi:putative transposase
MADVDRFLDELLKAKKPQEILGEDGVLKDLTRRLVERALEGELTDHLG